jgi:signal peptidase I
MQMPNVPDAIDHAEFEEVRVLRVQPGDVIVFRLQHNLSAEVLDEYWHRLKRTFPDNELLFLSPDVDMSVSRFEQQGLTDTEREADRQAALARSGGSMPPANLDGDSVSVTLSNGWWYAPGIPDDVAEELNRSGGTRG